jgi:hypothetical protein
LKFIAGELFFMCKEILGLRFEPVAAETPSRIQDTTSALTPAS